MPETGTRFVLRPRGEADPFALYAEMRRVAPVCQVDPGGLWIVTRYADVRFALQHPEVFSSQGWADKLEPDWIDYNPIVHSLVAKDPPEHTWLRRVVSRPFGKVLAAMEPATETIVAELCDDIDADADVEFISAYGTALPAAVLGDILTIDPGRRNDLKRWTTDLQAVSPVQPSDERVRELNRTIKEFEDYVRQLLVEHQDERPDDIVTYLLEAEIDGTRLTDDEIVSFLAILLSAGFETTVHLLGHSLELLATRPQDFQRLKNDPALIPQFVEEVLRMETPVHMFPRFTTQEVDLGGTTVPPGVMVMVCVASANRDETVFEAADQFDMDRTETRALPFGQGAHFCLGAPLARLEGRLTLEALTRRFTGVTVTGGPTWTPSLTVPGYQDLRVRFARSG